MLGGNTHDVSIMDSSTELGLMLARDQYGNLKYQEKEMPALNFMQAAGYVDEASQNPQGRYPVAFQSSWVGGFGQEFMKSDEPRRYLASYGVDASEEGKLKLGPPFTAVNWPTLTAHTALVAGTLETLTGWDVTSVALSTVQVHGGTYSALFDATNDLISQDVYAAAALPAEYQGRVFEFSAWIYQSAGNQLRVRIFDGVTTTYATSTTSGAFVRVTHRKVLAANATQLTVSIILAGAETAEYADDCTLVGPASSNANCYAEYNALQYLSLGNVLYKANSATAPTSWTYVSNFGSDITDLYVGQVAGTSYLFIMVGSGNNLGGRGYYYDGTTFTQITDNGGTDSSGSYITAGLTTVNVFYLAGRPTGVTTGAVNVIRSNDFDTAMTDAWSGDTVVGDANTNITGLATVNNVVYIAKEDSLWKVTTTGTVSMVVDYKYLFASTSGKGITGWNGKVYVPCGVNSLIEYDPDSGTYSDISPAKSVSSITQAGISTSGAVLSSVQADFDGRIMAVAGGNEVLWVLQDNGAVNNLFRGVYANIDTTGWHWHPIANTTMADVNCMAVSVLTTSPVIWAGHGTGNPGYYNLATYVNSDPTYTNAMLITPYYTGGVWRMLKALYSTILGLDDITATVYATVQFRFYGTSAWSTALTFDGASGTVTNGQDSNDMPTDSYGTAIQYRINLISNSASSSPKVTRLTGEGVIKPTEISVIECSVLLQDHQLTYTGVKDTMPASRKLSGLNTIRASSWPVTFYDITGTSHSVDLTTREDASAPERRLVGNNRFVKNLLMKKVTT